MACASSTDPPRPPRLPEEEPEKTQNATRAWDEPAGGTGTSVLEPGMVILDDYLVESHLGRGGMGTVYLVRSGTTQRRFAVKRLLPRRTGSPQHRRAFLRELLAWSDLPPHPHLAALRFFRTGGSEIFLFADYVEGGSLRDWLEEHRPADPAQLLDVAIQAAWGLQAAHRWGVAHQDVKPGNVLITLDGLAKLTDFGLARALGHASSLQGARGSTTPTSGGTPAFCSPEQAEGRRVTAATDVWSWGLTVLTLFAGEVSWASGRFAPEALEEYHAGRSREADRPPLPEPVYRVLQGCFQQDPRRRWAGMEEVAEALRKAYREALGSDHPRERPCFLLPPAGEEPGSDDRTAEGTRWRDPLPGLRAALHLAGRSEEELPELLPPGATTSAARRIRDLMILDETLAILEGLAHPGSMTPELEDHLASTLHDLALVSEAVDDFPGAVTYWRRELELREQDRPGEAGPDLARACSRLALALDATGRGGEALPFYRRAVEIWEKEYRRRGDGASAGALALALGALAHSTRQRLDIASCLELHGRARRIL